MIEEVYYKIYKKDNSLRFVCLQWFDESDYKEKDFVKLDGKDLLFYNENEANNYLEKLNNGIKITTTNNYVQTNIKVYYQKDIDELLKYKNAWEELKEQQKINEKNALNVGSCLELIRELETKNGIEVK